MFLKYENAKIEITKIIGKPAYAKASADNRGHRGFNAGGASCLTRKTTGEPSWLTISKNMRLEASSIEASSVVCLCNNFRFPSFQISISLLRSYV